MLSQLPLFPLGTVMVPGLMLPLHIFERRYRLLVAALTELPEGVPREFGMVARRPGADADRSGVDALYGIGCTVELREVSPLDDGRFDILVVGQSRFRLHEVRPDAGTPYHTGAVEILDEPDGEGDLELLADAVGAAFGAYQQTVRSRPAPLPDEPGPLSYLVAAATLLELPQRQALLELPTTSARLGAELRMLRREIALVSALRAVPAFDPSDSDAVPN